eukprot:6173335-Pleurochrysis_carterae.AAC.1
MPFQASADGAQDAAIGQAGLSASASSPPACVDDTFYAELSPRILRTTFQPFPRFPHPGPQACPMIRMTWMQPGWL